MANPTEQAIAAPSTPVTAPATTPSVAPAGGQKPERTETAVVDENFLRNLSSADQKALSKSIRDVIPRDKRGKALLPPETVDHATLATETEPEPVAPPAEPTPTVETPAPEPETTPEPTSPETTPAVVPEPEPEPEPTDGKLPQHRVRARDSFDDQVMRRYNNAIRDGAPLSMEACVAAEKAAQGILTPAKPTDAPAAPKALETANAELAEIETKLQAAAEAFDSVEVAKLTIAMRKKDAEIRDIQEDQRARQQSEAHKRQSAWHASESQAVTLYPQVVPDAVKGLSDEGKRLIAAKDRLFEEHKNGNDPIRFRTDYPLLLLKLAAAEEGIAPSTAKKAAPAAPKPVSVRSAQPAKPAPPLASASARTTPNGTGKPTAAELLPKLNFREAKELNKHFSSLLKR